VIVAAGLLVLLGLGLFVAGLATGATAFFWGCVAVCVVAAVLLVLARRQLTARPGERRDAAEAVPAAVVVAAASPSARAEPAATPPAAATASAPPPAQTTAAAEDGVPPGAPPAETRPAASAPLLEDGEPPVEEVEVTDLLLVVDLTDEVLVVDEHPRYHLPSCRYLAGREAIPLPLDEARTDGFTPCGVCVPDRNLAQRVRDRRAAQA
jgi:hypothetical protein